MAVTHNLSNNADNLSGFDPVAGESDGTTIGRGWVVWKIFEGLTAFNPNLVKITNAAPTPAWLQGQAGSGLQTEPAKNRSTAGDTIRFYDTTDPGLILGTPSAMIWEWKVSSSVTNGQNLFTMKPYFLISGGTPYNPHADGVVFLIGTILDQSIIKAGNTATSGTWATTTTIMANVPKVIFWKSNNVNLIVPIFKGDATYAGYCYWMDKSWAGYKHNVGAISNDGLNFRGATLRSATGCLGWDAISQTNYSSTGSSYDSSANPYIAFLNSIGLNPSALFTFSSKNNLIGGYARENLYYPATFKMLSDALDGIVTANTSLVAGVIGTVYKWDTNYYLLGANISDRSFFHKKLFLLGA